MPTAARSARLRAVTAVIEAAQAEAARSPLAGELLVLVALSEPARAYVIHRDDAIELPAHSVPGAAELRATLARTAATQLVAERATWRGRLARAIDALRGDARSRPSCCPLHYSCPSPRSRRSSRHTTPCRGRSRRRRTRLCRSR